MTVQELIDSLNWIVDKSKEIVYYYRLEIKEVEELNNEVILY